MKYIVSVSELNKYIKEIISRDLILSNVFVRGEISNYKYHYSGHMYFTLKDENSVLKSVMFKTNAASLKFTPENGLKVIVKGYISVFERDGQYQLYAEEMQPDGVGSLNLAFEQLKKKLESEGLFDKSHKKTIPMLPRSVGVITSSTGAVINDIINVTSRRYPNMDLKIFPVAVQGELAARQVVKALNTFNASKNVEVIIIARGGGSIEDLWAFNEEIVARCIYNSDIPVISAIGHETDFTIADFVADLRAPTPSAAAELVVPDKAALKEKLSCLTTKLRNSLVNSTKLKRIRLNSIMEKTVFKQPYDRVYQETMKLDIISKNMLRNLLTNKEKLQGDLSILIAKLDALSPLTVLSRGYSVIKSKKDGKLIKSVESVKTGDMIQVFVSDGTIECTVDSVKGISTVDS